MPRSRRRLRPCAQARVCRWSSPGPSCRHPARRRTGSRRRRSCKGQARALPRRVRAGRGPSTVKHQSIAAPSRSGSYLALHGAMGVRGVARPEADIARRVREVVGRDPFIAGTFDPHGNEDAEFLRQADFAFCSKYFPHYDSRLQGERAARMLIRAIRRDYTPVSATVKVPILTATVLQWTGASPWMDLVQRALVWEAREPDLYMNVFFGFPFADVPDVGMTVQAMTNGKPALARKATDDVPTGAWRRREALLKTATVHPIAEGVELAKEALAPDAWPAVLADHSDRSGSATWVLQQVIAQDLPHVLIPPIPHRPVVDAVLAKGLEARR